MSGNHKHDNTHGHTHDTAHDDAHGHSHDNTHVHSAGGCNHHHIDPAAGDFRIAMAVLINMILTVAQVIGGILSGSLALIADALHNFSDAIALIIAFGARKIARRPANHEMTFGYGRAEVVAALINYVTLTILGLYLIYEAVMRFMEPQPVAGWIIVIIASIALVIDIGTAWLTYAMSKTSMNIRAAFLHNVADALGSVAVIFAGTLIILYDWYIIDPIVTLLISFYILWHVYAEIGGVVRVLMLGNAPTLDARKVVTQIEALADVSGVHHVHVWLMGEHDVALDAHVVLQEGGWARADAIKAEIKQMLKQEFGLVYTTLEMECRRHACKTDVVFGHPETVGVA